MAKDKERFVTVYQQGVLDTTSVLVDRETGVNYIFKQAGHSGGLTVLLDKDGKPVVTPIEDDE